MKPRFSSAKSNRRQNFLAVAALTGLSASSAFATDRIRNASANSLINDAAWDTVAPTGSDRALWNSSSAGGATTLGGDASWSGIFIGSNTPSSVSFTNVANPSSFTLTLGSAGIDMNNGGATNRGITFESNTKLLLSANQTWKLGAGGSSANIVVSSVISGASSLEITRDVAGGNYVQLSGANTFSGGFTLGAGAVVNVGVAAVASPTGTTSSAFGSYDGSQLLTINGGRINSGNFAFHAKNASIAGDFTFASTFRTDLGGTFDLGSGTRTMTLTRGVNAASVVTGGGNYAVRFSGVTDGTATFGNGTLKLAADASVASGNFVAVNAGQGTAFTNNVGLILGDKVVYSTSSTGLNVANAVPSVTLEAGSYWSLAEGANVKNPQVNSLAGAGTVLSLYNGGTPSTACTLTIKGNSGTSTDFSGSIVDSDLTTFATSTPSVVGVTKAGNTTQIFSGTNTYTGVTTISAGTLQFAKQVSLYKNTPASWTVTNIVVNSGATLALNVGGSGEFTSSDVAALVSLGTASGGFKSGSKVGLDTTNAGGGFTYSSVLANPNAGANILGLGKIGSGTLLLNQVNTYTGGTTVEGGTLKIVQPGGIHTGSLLLNPGTSFEADFSALVAAGQITNTTTGSGTITATPPNASQLSFTSGTLTSFAGTINVKPSPASSGRVDFNGLIGSGSTVNIESGATARLVNSGTYSGVTVNVSGPGGSGPGALRMENGTLDSSCSVNLLSNASIGGFTITSTINAVIADGGSGYSLSKTGSSTLVLTATNTYTGGTSVTGGTLRISKPYLADSSDIVIGATAILDLNFDESGGAVTDTVSTLTIGGVQQPAGVYGATGSGAPVPDDTHFAGIGTLTVLHGPVASNTYASWIGGYSVGSLTGANDDFDNDGLGNAVENVLGSSPAASNTGLTQVSATTNSVKFRHSQSNTIATDVTKSYQWSTDLVEWKASGETNLGGITGTITQTTPTDNGAPDNDVIEVTVTATGGTPGKLFGRLVATKAP